MSGATLMYDFLSWISRYRHRADCAFELNPLIDPTPRHSNASSQQCRATLWRATRPSASGPPRTGSLGAVRDGDGRGSKAPC